MTLITVITYFIENNRVVTQYNGMVSNHLEQWGFQVTARTTPGNGDTEPIP